MKSRVLQLFLLTFAFVPAAFAQSTNPLDDYGTPPESHVLDKDHLYRSHPEVLEKISQHLKELKKKHNFDLYLIIYSGMIGFNAQSPANAYHEAWLGEKNDGIVFLIDVQNPQYGDTGQSEKLYNGDFIEQGIMPRIMIPDLVSLTKESSISTKEVESIHLRIEQFVNLFTNKIDERLSPQPDTPTPTRDSLHLMGLMAVSLLVIGFLIAMISKMLGRSDEKASRVYCFPNVLVGERLKAQNGGGKISWMSYGSPSEQ